MVEATLFSPRPPRSERIGFATRREFDAELAAEARQSDAARESSWLAFIDIVELGNVRRRLAPHFAEELQRILGLVVLQGSTLREVVAWDAQDRIAMLIRGSGEEQVRLRLDDLGKRIARRSFGVGGERFQLTAAIGFTSFEEPLWTRRRAGVAVAEATAQMDLLPRMYDPTLERTQAPLKQRLMKKLEVLVAPGQIAATFLVGFIIPFFIYYTLWRVGFDITLYAYLFVVAALFMTGTLIWVEGLLALRATEPPKEYGGPPPEASIVIAAYMPNEASTIVETVKECLSIIRWPTPIQVILAYNTPRDLPIEAVLREMDANIPNLTVIKVEGSVSKAQNVNMALPLVTGEIMGVFDADHHPSPDTFERAWRWLSNGFDVVQGHPMVRNGDATWVARMVAVEFEGIYSVSHPGRRMLHSFGLFGGSNGFWRTSLLRETRFRQHMLTEDIDSSMRILWEGRRIANDPKLISKELATTTIKQLWNQRMRWAQGWHQVTRVHTGRLLKSRNLTLRQRLGVFHLLWWREFYPWLSMQMFPIIAVFGIKARGLGNLDWYVPIFVFTTIYTLSVGPAQVFFAYKLAHPEIKKHKRWFFTYLFTSFFFYTEFKNLVARVAFMKELIGDRQWKITPRGKSKEVGDAHAQPAAAAAPAAEEQKAA